MKYMSVFLSHIRALSSSPCSFSCIALLCCSTLRTPVIRVNWKSSPITPSFGFQFLPFASSSKFHFFRNSSSFIFSFTLLLNSLFGYLKLYVILI